MLSNFWQYKIFTSKRQRAKYNSGKYNFAEARRKTGWTGPHYFIEAVDSIKARNWIREHLGLDNSEHIEVKVCQCKQKNDRAQSAQSRVFERQLIQDMGLIERKRRKAKCLVAKWLNPIDKRVLKA